MACIPFQTQLSSIMEALVKAAVSEISKLVDDKCAFLHLEISRKQNENENLRRRLAVMENKNAELQRGFENFQDRGDVSDDESRPQTEELKFPEIEGATVSFTIKEEIPDEALWISASAEAVDSTLPYPDPDDLSETQPFDEERPMTHSDVPRQKRSEFADSYVSAQRAGDLSGLQTTVKTEKDDRSGYGQDGCHRGSGKHSQLPDFSLEERDNHLWSSLIEGSDIDSAFPDFSSVVDEYSNTYPEPSDAVPTGGKASGGQQRACNGEYPKDPHSSHFQPRLPAPLPHQGRRRDQTYALRNASWHGEHPERGPDAGGGQPHALAAGYHPPPHPRPPPGATRCYICSLCGKSFARLHQFKLHQQSHKRKRAFWCMVCGKSFQCSSHLSTHHRTHTGEKPYGCGQCGKRFTQQSSLRVHQRTHSGERPYSCAQCGKTFILLHHLKRHRVIHTYS